MTNEIMQLLRDISNKDHWAKLRLLLSLVNVEHDGEWETNTWWMNWPDTMATQYIQRHIEGEMEAESKPMTEFVSYCGLVAMFQIVSWNMKCWWKLKWEHEFGDNQSYLFAYLRGAYLGGADLRDAYLRDADLRGADLRGADLRGAYLRGAYLGGADLRDADLRDAYLRGADLRGADLRGAYLRGAYLRGAYLRDADLRDAYLRDADLRGAYLRDVRYTERTTFPLGFQIEGRGMKKED